MANVVICASGSSTLVGERNSITAVGWVNYMATAGVPVNAVGRGEFTHLIAMKNSTITLGVWGYSAALGNWVRADTVTFGFSNCGEVAPLRTVSSYDRVQSTVDSIGASGSANVFWMMTGGA